MNRKNNDNVSFEQTEKESFRDRLRQLIGERSVRAAARDWGLSFSTLNNYLHKGTEPVLSTVQLISEKEQVSIDWLANGGESKTASTYQQLDMQDANKMSNAEQTALRNALSLFVGSLDDSEANELLRIVHRKGIEGLLSAAGSASLQQSDDIEHVLQLIESLPLKQTIKQAMKMVVLAGDDDTPREILDIIKKTKQTVPSEEIAPTVVASEQKRKA